MNEASLSIEFRFLVNLCPRNEVTRVITSKDIRLVRKSVICIYKWAIPWANHILWTLRKASTQISLSMPRKLTRIDNFLWIFFFRNHYSIPLSPLDGMCRPVSVCVDYAGRSGSIQYAEAMMFVFSQDGSNKVQLFCILFLKLISV